ncbi:SGS [Penicillium camemberti]|uniref:SGS n=1 Tax=Penicillium camemberti (strain FM 013) TaxID=1429867 RepID=A0A0G4PJV1_PENC3|nr:SGS [Penicillium camemberti]
MDAAAKGDKASARSNYRLAIEHYTHALSDLPRAPAYYISRSTAYSRLKPEDGGPDYQAALKDAGIALQIAKERGNRELILSAQMRRAVSLYQLERYGDAGFVFGIIANKTKSETVPTNRTEQVQAAMGSPGSGGGGRRNNYSAQLPIWIAKLQHKDAETPADDPKRIVSVQEYPSSTSVPTRDELKDQWLALKAGNVGIAGASQQIAPQLPGSDPKKAWTLSPGEAMLASHARHSSANAAAEAASIAPEKVRHEWYQSQDSVVVTLYVKGISNDSVAVDLKEAFVSLQFPLPSGSEYNFTLDPLYAAINPAESKVSVKGTKIEITLRKKTAGQKWNDLEGSATNTTEITSRPAAQNAPAPASPSYPTSSRHGTKDWDKVASSLTEKKPTEKSGGDENAADASDDEGGDAVDGFFKKLYASADPETRRAMIKSYTESQGTSLSTNWSEVAKGKVEAHHE